MFNYRVKFNGKLVGNIRAEDMSEASRSAGSRTAASRIRPMAASRRSSQRSPLWLGDTSRAYRRRAAGWRMGQEAMIAAAQKESK